MANTYTGTTTVNAGAIVAARTAGVTSIPGAVVINGGVFALLTSNQISDAASVSVNGGSFGLFNNSETIGSLAGTAGGSVNFGNGSVNTLTVGGDNSSTTYAGVITGTDTSDGVIKQGTGTLSLSGANTYAGSTTVSGGTLQIGNGGTTGTLGSGNIINNGMLVFNRTNSLTVANVISGTGSLTQAGNGITVFSGTSTYSGGTAAQKGTLKLGANNALPVGTTVTFGTSSSNGTLDLAGFNQQVGGLVVDINVPFGSVASQVIGNSSVTANSRLNFFGSGLATFDGTITDALASGNRTVALSVSNGNLKLTGDNLFIGGTLITGSSSTVRITSNTALGTGAIEVATGCFLGLNNNITVANPLTLNGASGSGSLANTSGNNTYSGSITLAGSSGILANPSTVFAITGPVYLAGNNLTVTAQGPVTVSSAVTGIGGSVTMNGYSTLTLGGANTFTGDTIIITGTLKVNHPD